MVKTSGKFGYKMTFYI